MRVQAMSKLTVGIANHFESTATKCTIGVRTAGSATHKLDPFKFYQKNGCVLVYGRHEPCRET